jgi:hypothetical protein
MKKYLITFCAISLSVGLNYAAAADLRETVAIGGSSLLVIEGDLLASCDGESSSLAAAVQAPVTVKSDEHPLTPDVRGIVGEGDTKADDADSTHGNSGTPTGSDEGIVRENTAEAVGDVAATEAPVTNID